MFVVLGRRIDPGPAASPAEPMMPPMSAWLLDVGRPHSHVTRSHTIAPTTPPMMMAIEWWNAASLSGRAFTPRMFVSMIPLPIVSAIAFVMKTIPTKLPAAAMATAFVGVRTFVATIVAIAFAASWNPLKKSNRKTTRIATMRIVKRSPFPVRASARPSIPPRETSGDSLILRHDVAQHVGDVLAVVRGLLEDLGDLLELDDRHGILLTEEGRDGVVHEVVGDVLEAVDLDGEPLDPVGLFHVADHPDGLLEEPRPVFDHVSELHHRLGRTFNFIEADPARGCLDHVEDIVELGSEGLNVLPVDWRDERLVQFLVNPMDDLVAVVLHVLDPSALHRHVAEVVQQVRRGDRTLVDRGGELLEEVEKLALLRDNPSLQTHGPSLPVNAVVLVHH